VCLTAVVEQRVNIKFCDTLGKIPPEMLQTVYIDEALSGSRVLQWFKRFKEGMRIFKMSQESGVLQPLEMQTQSQMSVKW
jgi:hypothetical protein